MRIRLLCTAAAFACLTFGQTAEVDKVFHFAHATTPKEFQEIISTIRSIAEIRQAAVSAEARTLAVHGTTEQIGAADWLFHAVDKASAMEGTPPVEYRLDDARNPVVRVYYLSHANTPQIMQEVINTVRSIAEIQFVTGCTTPQAIVLRSDPDHMALADWLISALDVPAGTQKIAPPPDHRIKDAHAPVAHVVYLASIDNLQHMAELVNTIRSISELQRVVMNNAPNAIAIRGSEEQVKMAEWIAEELDRPQGTPTAGAHQSTSTVGGLGARIFYLRAGTTPQALQETVTQIKTVSRAQRVISYSGQSAIVMRARPEQIAEAERLIQENEKPAQ